MYFDIFGRHDFKNLSVIKLSSYHNEKIIVKEK